MSQAADDLAARVAHLAAELYVSEDVDETLRRLVDVARAVVPGCTSASVTRVSDGSGWTPAATDDRAVAADEVQYRFSEGPCLDAAESERAVYTPDLEVDQRWPKFSSRVPVEVGFHSLLSTRLTTGTERRPLGALNLYADEHDAFPEEGRDLALLLSSFASVALAAADQELSLKEALASRDVIGQAKGILMERHRVDENNAFDMLREASQHLNVKLRDVASQLAQSGELPQPRNRPAR